MLCSILPQGRLQQMPKRQLVMPFKIIVAIFPYFAYNKNEPLWFAAGVSPPTTKCEALQQVFRHLYPKCGTLKPERGFSPLFFVKDT